MKKSVITILAIVALGWGTAWGTDRTIEPSNNYVSFSDSNANVNAKGALLKLPDTMIEHVARPLDVRTKAGAAAVMIGFDIPIVLVKYTSPLPDKVKVSLKDVRDEIRKEITEAIKNERAEQSEGRHEEYLTSVEKYGVKVHSRDRVPLGLIAPKYAQYPAKILAVYEVDKKNIKAWEKDFEKDILTISETVNVSPKEAERLVNRLEVAGYTINKEEADEGSEVKLLYFKTWDESRPSTLDWEVKVEGSDENILIDYDPRGILIIKPIPENADGDLKRVFVKAGYYDLKAKYKPKSRALTSAEEEVERYKELYETATKEIEKEEPKRDISKVTFYDVMTGHVSVSLLWVRTAASGVFLGNMVINKETKEGTITTNQYGWSWGGQQTMATPSKGLILTNAHVADMARPGKYDVYISKDKERMYIVFRGYAHVRYTPESDMYGTSANILSIDGGLVMSWDFDCAIMTTSVVPAYEKYRAILGDSEKVKSGDKVFVSGNPMLMQGFLTQGIISKTNYSVMDSMLSTPWINDGLSRAMYNWAKNSRMWYDAPIGVGGTSGSGVWMADGLQAGKVIALHNMGLVTRYSLAGDPTDENVGMPFNIESLVSTQYPAYNPKLLDFLRGKGQDIFSSFPYRDAKHSIDIDVFTKDNDAFKTAMQTTMSAYRVDVSGMNGAVPINLIAQYLQERGLNTAKMFGWKGLGEDHWIK